MRRRIGFLERVNRALWLEDDPKLEFWFKAAFWTFLAFFALWVIWEASR